MTQDSFRTTQASRRRTQDSVKETQDPGSRTQESVRMFRGSVKKTQDSGFTERDSGFCQKDSGFSHSKLPFEEKHQSQFKHQASRFVGSLQPSAFRAKVQGSKIGSRVWGSGSNPAHTPEQPRALQGYLAHKKPRHSRTLQYDYATV